MSRREHYNKQSYLQTITDHVITQNLPAMSASIHWTLSIGQSVILANSSIFKVRVHGEGITAIIC